VACRQMPIARLLRGEYTGNGCTRSMSGGEALPLSFRLEDYARYSERVGEATYIDLTRRTDPARVIKVWSNLKAVVDRYGPPWVVQVWTKDAEGVLKHGAGLLASLVNAGTTITAQVTVTGLGGTKWEPKAPEKPFAGVPALAEATGGPGHVTWRYDPVIPTLHRLDRYRKLARRAADLGITRSVLNFVAPPGRYKRVDRRLAGELPGWGAGLPWYDTDWKVRVAGTIVSAAGEEGIRVACCAESANLSERVPNLQPAACGDYRWFVALSGRDPGRPAGGGSRRGCGCAPYFDVGVYGQWRRCHGCLYCYAG